jgi:ABC-2 type transport system permease protein
VVKSVFIKLVCMEIVTALHPGSCGNGGKNSVLSSVRFADVFGTWMEVIVKRAWNNFVKYRFLLAELVKKDIKLKYRRSYLGILWTLIEPMLTTAVLWLIFGKLMSRGGQSFPVYILTGRLLYTFFANSTKASMKSIRKNGGMIKKVYVPKYMYPLSSVLSNYIMFLISLIVLFFASIIFRVMPTGYIFQAIIPLIIILVLTLGVGMILATLAVFFRDLEYLWSVILMLIMYTSAIFYYTDHLKLKGSLWIFNLNPLYTVIVNFRDAVFGTPLHMTSFVMSILYSFGSLIIGVVLFYKKQDEFILNI